MKIKKLDKKASRIGLNGRKLLRSKLSNNEVVATEE
jgi:hypothetical protein